jgi:hypothetical protein
LSQNNSSLEEEIESWKGFPWALRKEDKELWDAMMLRIREGYKEAVEKSGKNLTTDPFFMALLLEQQKIIKFLEAELNVSRAKQTTL